VPETGDTARVDINADLNAACPPAGLVAWVDDLSVYPQWMGLVHRAEALGDDSLGRPTWSIELRARLGPFARSKRLTMVRTEYANTAEAGHAENWRVVFERGEPDGRKHSVWRLSVQLAGVSTGSRLDMNLHYGGGMWVGGLVERALEDEIAASRERLLTLIGETTP
jgi:hypothetical protein